MDEQTTDGLLIRLDETRGIFQFLPHKGAREDTRTDRGVVHEMESDATKSAESFEYQIGQFVLAFFSANSTSEAFGLVNYRAAGQDFAAWQRGAGLATDEGQRMFEQALLLLDDFDDSWTAGRLDEVQALMTTAAEKGAVEARTYLSDRWSKRREILMKRISRSSR